MRKSKKQFETEFNNVELTVYQKVALKGEIGMAYETAISQEDKEYSTYLLCYFVNKMPEYTQFYKDEMLKYVDEETYTKYRNYAFQGIFPKPLMERKIVADLKVYLGKEECLLDGKVPKMPPNILISKFVNYMRTVAEIAPVMAKDILRAVIADDSETLEEFKEVCFTMLMDIKGQSDLITEPWAYVKLFQPRIVDSYVLMFEHEVESVNKESDKVEQDFQDSSVASNPIKTTYTVKKIDKSSGIVVFEKKFDTLEDASKYIKDIGENYKELLDRYKFTIN